MSMIIEETVKGFEIRFQWDQAKITAIKSITGSYFRSSDKTWIVPGHREREVDMLKKRFGVMLDPVIDIPEQVAEIAALPELTMPLTGIIRTPFPFQTNGIARGLELERFINGDKMGLGKALAKGSKVLTPEGFKNIEFIRSGDYAIGADGKPTKVTGWFPQGKKKIFNVTFSEGSKVKCCDEHLWEVYTPNSKYTKSKNRILSLKQIIETGIKIRNGNRKYYVPIVKPVEFSGNLNLLIDPYFLGLLIGDGGFTGSGVVISSADQEIIDHVKSIIPKELRLNKRNKYDHRIVCNRSGGHNKLIRDLKFYQLFGAKSGNKFIPPQYLYAKIEDRIKLLQGLMDTDGWISRDGSIIQYTTVSEKLHDNFVELVRGLGGIAKTSTKQPRKNGENYGQLAYNVSINMPEGITPFSLERKRLLYKTRKKYQPNRSFENIEYVGEEECYCIRVEDERHLFVTDDYVLTHNTYQAIATAVLKGCKCILVICPATLKINWQREWLAVAGNRAMILSDRYKSSWQTFHEIGEANVFIVNYESLKKFFVKSGWSKPKTGVFRMNMIPFRECINLFDCVIVDECHRTKDGTRQNSKMVMGICQGKETIMFLSGTSLVNKPKDLISQLNAINRLKDIVSHIPMPMKDGRATDPSGYKRFINRYCGGGSGATNLKELRFRLWKYCFFSREKHDVLKDLPPKTRQIIQCEIDNRAEYQNAETKFEQYLKEVRGCTEEEVARKLRGELMVKMGVLRQISARGKIGHLKEMVDDLIESGEKVVLFCNLIDDILLRVKELYPQAAVVYGDVVGEKRQAQIDKFQQDPNCNVIICNYRSGGEGITLTASSQVRFIEFPWTWAACEQCEDRCIAAGQLIMTKGGFNKIENVRKGDEVYTHKGRWRKVTDLWSKLERKKSFVDIKYYGYDIPLTCTIDHRIYCWDLIEKEFVWVEAGNVNPDKHMFVLPNDYKESMDISVNEIEIEFPFGKEFSHRSGTKMNNGRIKNPGKIIELTEDLMYGLGWYLAEGWCSIAKSREKGSCIAICGNKEKEESKVKNIAESLRKGFGLEDSKVSHSSNKKNCFSAYIYSKNLAYNFNKWFGSGSNNKKIPDFVFECDENLVSKFLKGYYEGDGYRRKNTQQATTASDQIVIGLIRLEAMRLNPITLRKSIRGPWSFEYSLRDKIKRPTLIKNNHNCVLFPIMEVKKYKPRKGRDRVYDLTVEEDESFTVGLAAVHNCHRIGQEDNVTCGYLFGVNTIDEYCYNLILRKKAIMEQVTGTGMPDIVADEIVNELLNLFSQRKSQN